MKRKGFRRPTISKKQQRQRRAIVFELLSRMERLQEELQTCTSIGRRSQIAAELGRLRRKSGRDRIKARFLQGGAPGTGK